MLVLLLLLSIIIEYPILRCEFIFILIKLFLWFHRPFHIFLFFFNLKQLLRLAVIRNMKIIIASIACKSTAVLDIFSILLLLLLLTREAPVTGILHCWIATIYRR